MKTTTKTGRKLLAGLISAAVMISMIPAMAFAADTPETNTVTVTINSNVNSSTGPKTFDGITVSTNGSNAGISYGGTTTFSMNRSNNASSTSNYTFAINEMGGLAGANIVRATAVFSACSGNNYSYYASGDFTGSLSSSGGTLTYSNSGTSNVNSITLRLRCYKSNSQSSSKNATLSSLTLEVEVPVRTVTISGTLSAFAGTTSQLTATVTPTGAQYRTVTWTSSNPGVAKVDANGLVTGVAAGDATITATCGGVSSESVEFIVYNHLDHISISPATLDLFEDSEPANLEVTYSPATQGDTLSSPVFESDDEDVVKVSNDGVVTVAGVGDATITVTVYDETLEKDFTATCAVSVEAHLAGIAISPATLDLNADSEPATLTVSYSPETSGDELDPVVFESSNESVVKVSDTGVVTVAGVGSATITASVYDATLEETFTATCAVTVSESGSDMSNDKFILAVAIGVTEEIINTYSDVIPADLLSGLKAALAFAQDIYNDPEATDEDYQVATETLSDYLDDVWEYIFPEEVEVYYTEEQLTRMSVQNFVEGLYMTILGRQFDAAGRDSWMNSIFEQGGTATSVAIGFLESPEFTSKNLSNEEFIAVCYRVFCNRAATADETAQWVAQLDANVSRDSVIRQFAQSPEWASICAYFRVNV